MGGQEKNTNICIRPGVSREQRQSVQMNKTVSEPCPDSPCVHQLVERQAILKPRAIAATYQGQKVTYAELNARANRIAHSLIKLGVLPEDCIVLCVDRSLAMVVGILAILKAGGAYVPIDPVFSSERSTRIFNEVRPKIVISDEVGRAALDKTITDAVTVIDPNVSPDLPSHNPEVPQLRTQNLAQVVFTSGSTGVPKGVMIEHCHIMEALYSCRSWFDFDPSDKWCLLQSISFGFALWPLSGSLHCGAELVIAARNVSRSPRELQRLVCEESITVLSMTPSLLKVYIAHSEGRSRSDNLRKIIVAGEIFDPCLLRPWYASRDDNRPQIINCYGATEITIFGVWRKITKHDLERQTSPIGTGDSVNRIYLLDDHDEPVPTGVTGEIYVHSSCVARGYLNRPELSRERFLRDHRSHAFNAGMFRTGDLAYFSHDGDLTYVKRNDLQVKLRGFRIDPYEIEAVLVSHPGVHQAVVVLVDGESVDRLIAFVKADDIENLEITLRDLTSNQLPDYMVPSAFVRVEEFPLMPNGKVDRSALSSPKEMTLAYQTYEAPRSIIEIELADIWEKLLSLERVGRHDSFFVLGGHSLVAPQMIASLRSRGWNLNIIDLFNHPVLCELAAKVTQHRHRVIEQSMITQNVTILTPDMLPLIDLTQKDIDRIVARIPGGVANIQDIYSLSPLQDGILFHYLLATNNDPYIITSLIEFSNRSQLNNYLKAFECVAERHDILRTSFVWVGLSVPAQVVWRRAPFSITELTIGLDDDFIDSDIASSIDRQYCRIDVEQAPLVRFVISRTNSERWVMLQVMHHLVGDETTVDMIHAELQVCLRDHDDLPRPVQYRSLINEVRLTVGDQAYEAFFTKLLSDIDSPTLPFGIQEVNVSITEVTQSQVGLKSYLLESLRRQAKNFNVSLATLCHVAWTVVISRACDQKKVVFGTVLLGRMRVGGGKDSAMGLYVNTLPFRLDVDDIPVDESLRQTQTTLAKLLELEYASLASVQRCSGIIGGTPLFNSLLNFRNQLSAANLDHYPVGIKFHGTTGYTNYPLTMLVNEYETSVVLTAQVVNRICSKRVCNYMQRTFESIIDALGETEQRMLRSIEVMPETELTDLLNTRNITERVYPDPPCIHHIFEQQARLTPDAIAIVHAQQELTYGELNMRANRLAHQLIGLGASRGDRVAFCIERSPTMIIGALAILKTGAAYVPIDPAYSSQRSLHILDDATPKITLVDDVGLMSLGNVGSTKLLLINPDSPSQFSDVNPILPDVNSENVAYTMYTSGTTGKPKGVIVRHRNVVRLFDATEVCFEFDCADTWCLLHSIGFDVSVWELWGATCHGGKLVIVSQDILRSPEDLRELVWKQGVTVMSFTPSAFAAFANNYEPPPTRQKLRHIILIGERVDGFMLRAWYATHSDTMPQIVNMYGPTEATVYATYKPLTRKYVDVTVSLIGKPLPHNKIYLLDNDRRPVPPGVVGEIYIGGGGVATGYLNRTDLTNERFRLDPFSDAFDAFMYRTGDLAYYLEDADIAYVGRNDQQVKIRGFRIELGEIEACLLTHPAVHQARVLVVGNDRIDRLVAYVITKPEENLAVALREYISTRLPEYMVPSAFVELEEFPITKNGKLDLSALPALDESVLTHQSYEAPQGSVEIALANIWRRLLNLETVGRHDSFFALGGHSLLAVQVSEHLRSLGWSLTLRDLFNHPVLSQLAGMVKRYQEHPIPPNMITTDTKIITPDMLPLIELTQADIDKIIHKVPGGIADIQDIYALSPLQDGMLFHHLLTPEDDPYQFISQLAFTDRHMLDRYLEAIQNIVDRHDIFRTALISEGLTRPAQVVFRHAIISVVETAEVIRTSAESCLFPSESTTGQYRIDLETPPLMRYVIVRAVGGKWILNGIFHHVIIDHTTVELIYDEVRSYILGQQESLLEPNPYRNLIAGIKISDNKKSHETFFKNMLQDINEPTLPYGITDVYSDGTGVTELYRMFSSTINDTLRNQARRLDVNLASVFHLAFALMISRTSCQNKVVFGTVLHGRTMESIRNGSSMGLFINTLPVRIDVDETTVYRGLKRTHKLLTELLDHEHASLVLAQRCSTVGIGVPVFSSLLNFRHNRSYSMIGDPITGVEFMSVEERTNYPLVLSVEEHGTALGVTARVVSSISAPRLCDYMQQTLESMIDALGETDRRMLRSIEVMPETERTDLLNTRNITERVYPDPPCIHHIFEQQARLTPDAIAIVHAQQELTYGELNMRANRLAHQLIGLGASRGDRVAFCIERSPTMIIGALAILKTGAAYVPIDPAYSSQRSLHILDDATPKITLVDDVGLISLGNVGSTELLLINPDSPSQFSDVNPILPDVNSEDVAYTMYTSGTTGKPKGVIVRHRNVVRLFDATEVCFEFDCADTWCLLHSIGFDVSVWELWGATCHGGKLVIVSQDILRSPEDLRELVWKQGVTVMSFTPSAFAAFANNYEPPPTRQKLRHIILIGERVDGFMLRAWYATHSDTMPQLVNMYGPTEATVCATYKPLTRQYVDVTVSLIGKPLPHNKIYLLDNDRRPVPPGVVGEIYIGGGGVATGYLNRTDLTNERFRLDPFSDAFDAFMYRTGDLAYYLEDADIAYVGRNDQQVKIRGFRIELGEIEACLLTHPAVHQARVLVVGNDRIDRLVAYVITKPEENLAVALREYTSTRLPEYMVPSAFVELEEFPITQNGKLDLSALPALDESVLTHQSYKAPQGSVEIALANIWRRLLNLETVGRHDSFFALGGHSLLAVQVSAHLRSLGWSLTLRDLFNHPVLSQLAGMVERYQEHHIPPNMITMDTKIITPDMLPLIELTQADIDRIIQKVPRGIANIQDIYALTPLQDGMLFHHLLAPEDDPYHSIRQFAFTDRSVLDRYLSAIQRIVDRHDIIRTAFFSNGLTVSAQVVWRHATISVVEMSEDVETFTSKRFSSFDTNSGQYCINLEDPPLLRYLIAREASGRWILNEIIHHLIIDHATIEIMHDEIRAFVCGMEETLRVPNPYRNFIAELRFGGDDDITHDKFFRMMLGDVCEPTLPYGIAEVHNDGSALTKSHRTLIPENNDLLRNYARKTDVSLVSIFHLAFGLVISRTSSQQNTVFGTVLSGRTRGSIGDGPAMGLFINTLPFRITVDDTTLYQSLKRTHKLLAQLMNHEHASLALAQRCSSTGANRPLFSALLNYRHNPSHSGTADLIPGVELLRVEDRTNYPLVLAVGDDDSALDLSVQTVPSICAARVCDYMYQALESFINSRGRTDDRPLRSIEVMPKSERTDLLRTRNHVETKHLDLPCIHHIFERRAKETPDATAIVYAEQELTYEELNVQANQLARQLIDLGASRNDRIALCVERSPAMIIGILAILKTGAAYVAIDPAHSSHRLSHVLEDAAPTIALVDEVGRLAIGDVPLASLRVLDPNVPSQLPGVNPVQTQLDSKDLAYIIYTSGTTGKPKGVMVPHRNIVRLFDATDVCFSFDRTDTWCLFHSIAFDFSVWELWGALRNGAKLIIVSRDVSRSPREFNKLIREQGVTVLNLTPNTFRIFVENYECHSMCETLRYIVFGGDVLDCSRLRSWYATHADRSPQLVNMYGITETTVHATCEQLTKRNAEQKISPIGKRLPDNEIYLLDSCGRPVPLGVVGEMYIGGAGVTSGYLNRNDLTSERFVPNPFSDAFDARMYRTGDLAYYLKDGGLAYMGRNDQQVKIRGFRIEPGELENCLMAHPNVQQVLVHVVSDREFDNLIAYVIAEPRDNLNFELREYATANLPEYMVPSAFVRLDEFPLTQNGKIDRAALPAVDSSAFASQEYDEPRGPFESELATIWSDLLKIDKVSRRDSFFALGGHSLLAVRLIEQLRARGWKISIRDLFNHPILYVLAGTMTQHQGREVPPNVIDANTEILTPDMLPLIELTQSDINRIVTKVPGGISNIQDIYSLSPLQEGILFHNLLATEKDPYLVTSFMRFTDRNLLDNYLNAVQRMIARHDILRTAFLWENLSVPAQVVWRQTSLSVIEVAVALEEGSVYDQFRFDCLDRCCYSMDLQRAPLLRFVVIREHSGCWLACQLMHHLIGDETTIRSMCVELRADLNGSDLPNSIPYRNLVHTMRTALSADASIGFFTEMLRDVNAPTLPFDLYNVHTNDDEMTVDKRMLTDDLMKCLRSEARNSNIGIATLCHVACALVLSRICDQKCVVFGTVLIGRMHSEHVTGTALGLYINTLPIRLDVDDNPVGISIREAHKMLADLLEHEHASLTLAQRCSAISNGQPLFSTLFNFRQQQFAENSKYPSGIEFLGSMGYTNYPLTISVDDDGSTMCLIVDAVRPACARRLCAYMYLALESLVAAVQPEVGIPLCLLEVLPPDERMLMVESWNMIGIQQCDYPCIHQLFEQQVRQTPNAVALVYEGETMTYVELNIRANRLAHELIYRGVMPETLVGLCVARSTAMIVGVLAILKAGGTYVPVDPNYACERLSYILTDANPSIVLTDDAGQAVLNAFDLNTFRLLDPNTPFLRNESNPVVPRLVSTYSAYIIYTSGSTGKPKGVIVQHRNIVRLFSATDSWFNFNQNDVWCLFHSIAFDFSVWELWGSLSKGGKLIIVSQDTRRDLRKLIDDRNVTILNLTPGAFTAYAAACNETSPPTKLRYIIFGGEKLECSILRSWFATHGDASPQLVNMYGITETTVHATYKPLTRTDAETAISPIGKRIPDNETYLLDSHGRPVPLGAVGEIYIGGAGVTRGYLNRTDLTTERFLQNPFSEVFDARMYRTGDLAYYLENGDLAYVGRNDKQVKVRGFRIELPEVEACLMTHPKVRQTLVRIISNAEVDRLVAYVVSDTAENLSVELPGYVSSQLPEYMVPSAFVMLDEFPLTEHGKIDCSALSSLDQTTFSSQEGYERPQTPMEIELSRVWSELLGIDRVGRNDSFFALGGNSLHAVRMTERMRSIGWTLHVRDLFDHPILFELANDVVQHQEFFVPPNVLTADVTELTPEMFPLIDLTQSDIDKIITKVPGGISNIQDIYALSPLQDGLLFHNRFAPEDDPYNLVCRMSFTVRDLLDRYLAAIQLVVERHDILRTAFVWEGMTTPAQVVWRVAPILVEEMTGVAQSFSSSTQISTSLPDVQQYHVSLDKAPLLRYLIVRGTSGSWILTELSHHLIIDHSTLELIHGEVRAFLCDENANLPQPSPFRNFIAEVRFGLSQNNHESFFKEMLADIDEPTMPFGILQVYQNESNVTESSEMLTSEMDKRLRALARNLNVSLTAIFHLAYAILISVTSGRKNVVFGTVLLGRMKTDVRLDSSLGLFINTLPIRVNVDETPVRQSLRDTHRLLARFFDHEHASLALAQRCSTVENGMPLFTALFNYRHNKSSSNQPKTIPGIEFLTAKERTNYPVNMAVEDYDTKLGLTTQVVHPICSERFRSNARQAVVGIADALEQLQEVPVQFIDILPCEERTELLETRNSTINEYAELSCIHHHFELQTKQTPEATALLYADETISYAELNVRANRLAHQLIDLGVTKDERVALCVQRSPAMIVGILAILKSGAAYVPIDPAYSSDRSLYILNDAAPRIAILDQVGRSALRGSILSDLIVLDPESPSHPCDNNPILSFDDSRNLCYVIYTSGSTGKPKGVLVEHKNVVRVFITTNRWLDFRRQDKWWLFTSIAFDFSVWEVFGPLTSGAELIIVPQDSVRSPHELHEIICKHEATIVGFTPSAFSAFIEIYVNNPVPDKLRYVVLGGEKFDISMLRPWFAIRGDASPQVLNMYGPAETAVYTTGRALKQSDTESTVSPIGTRILDNRIYLLNDHGQPVPMGVVGEIYIGGAGVTRGYHNREDLSNERFLADPFSDAFDARMYQTGDLARYFEDGSLAFEGRNDHQIKIRGFRIEPLEIQFCLMTHPAVRQAFVLAISDNNSNKLVAYIVSDAADNLGNILREYLLSRLPDYMVPARFVLLDELPLNPNGKINHFALRELDRSNPATETYEEPRGYVEVELARIWCEMLGVDKVGRHDSFFVLGGHSLLAVRLIEQLSSRGWKLRVRDLFNSPNLFRLAAAITQHEEPDAPPNMIKSDTTMISPDMLPLIELCQSDIDYIVSKVPGGIANIQDIYALSSLQLGILLHNVLSKHNDPYLSLSFIEFTDRSSMDRYMDAFQSMINRHDILRTALVWQTLSIPAQVVWRRALLSVNEVELAADEDSVLNQFRSHCMDLRRHGMDLENAPLVSFVTTRESSSRWFACRFMHHLIGDATTMQAMHIELQAHLNGGKLPNVMPYRNLVHSMRTGLSDEANSRFFTEMLREVERPTLPFGLSEVHVDGAQMTVTQRPLANDLATSLRTASRNFNVGVATLCHVAWALVLSRVCDLTRVVFGTVLFGRMHTGRGSGSAMGLYINTLPLRVNVDDTLVEMSVRKVHNSLADLLEHEHASLALAQRCSSVPNGQTLFSSLLNFRRHQVSEMSTYPPGITFLETVGCSNYPLNVHIDDDGSTLHLTVDSVWPASSERVYGYMRKALESCVASLQRGPSEHLRSLEVVPDEEKQRVMETWSTLEFQEVDYPCIHQLFEQQVILRPNAIAVVFGRKTITYAQLNSRANQLAHELIESGISTQDRVGLCVARSAAMVVGVLAILKAGAAYVPIDTKFTFKRLSYILSHAAPSIVLVDEEGRMQLEDVESCAFTMLDLNSVSNFPNTNPWIPELCATHLAHVIYSTELTGRPKGVMVQHRNVVGLFNATDSWFHFDEEDVWCMCRPITSDFSVWELWGSLSRGGKLVIVSQTIPRLLRSLPQLVGEQNVTVLNLTPSTFAAYVTNYVNNPISDKLRHITIAEGKVHDSVLRSWYAVRDDTLPQLVNSYGTPETTLQAAWRVLTKHDSKLEFNHIGKRIPNSTIHLLDSDGRPVPLGVVGEIYIGGLGVTSGYLNWQAALSERFLPDLFSNAFDARMYRTGDFAYYLEDGTLVFATRNE